MLAPLSRSGCGARASAFALVLLLSAVIARTGDAGAANTWDTRESAAILSGESIAVQDGDSFILRTEDGRRLRIRIEGIDAPEKGQPFADVSRRHLAALLRARSLTLEVRKVDLYGRQVARVRDGDIDIGLAQLQAGLAWFFRRYQAEQPPTQRRAYAQAETHAREAGAGLWRDAAPQPPWEYRRQERKR